MQKSVPACSAHVRKEIFQAEVSQADMDARYREYFPKFIKKGVEIGLLNEELGRYDLKRMAAALKPENDLNFDYLGCRPSTTVTS